MLNALESGPYSRNTGVGRLGPCFATTCPSRTSSGKGPHLVPSRNFRAPRQFHNEWHVNDGGSVLLPHRTSFSACRFSPFVSFAPCPLVAGRIAWFNRSTLSNACLKSPEASCSSNQARRHLGGPKDFEFSRGLPTTHGAVDEHCTTSCECRHFDDDTTKYSKRQSK